MGGWVGVGELVYTFYTLLLAARAEPLLAAPGTCATAMHGSTDTTGGRGAGLLEVTYWKVAAGGGRSAHVATWEVRAPAAVPSPK